MESDGELMASWSVPWMICQAAVATGEKSQEAPAGQETLKMGTRSWGASVQGGPPTTYKLIYLPN